MAVARPVVISGIAAPPSLYEISRRSSGLDVNGDILAYCKSASVALEPGPKVAEPAYDKAQKLVQPALPPPRALQFIGRRTLIGGWENEQDALRSG